MKEIDLEQLCKEVNAVTQLGIAVPSDAVTFVATLIFCLLQVWPALVVIGGLDHGLRVGGLCHHKQSGKRATILGTLKQGMTNVKVMWHEMDYSVR